MMTARWPGARRTGRSSSSSSRSSTVLIGIGALVIDGGSWFQSQRHLQTAADAAALAGVQDLPAHASAASSGRDQLRADNYTGAAAPAVTFPSTPSSTLRRPACRHASALSQYDRLRASSRGSYGAVFNNVTVQRKRRQRQSPSRRLLKNVAPVAVKNTVACAATSPSLLRPDDNTSQVRREQCRLEHDRPDQPHVPLDGVDGVRLVTPASAAAS